MNSDELRRIVFKIQASGCLTTGEMQRQISMANSWEILLNIDHLDREWETDLKQHVCGTAKLGRQHLPTTISTLVYSVLGVICVVVDVFIGCRISEFMSAYPSTPWIAAGVLGAACLMFYLALYSFRKTKKYKPALQAYAAARQRELQMLPKEHRPTARICLKCLQYTE